MSRFSSALWRILFALLLTLSLAVPTASAHEQPVEPAKKAEMLELLSKYNFGWAVNNLERFNIPILWSDEIPGIGAYRATDHVVLLSTKLQGRNPILQTAYLAHEATHVSDDLDPQPPHTYGHLKDVEGWACHQAEMHAFTAAADWLGMATNGLGFPHPEPKSLEEIENFKMHGFRGEWGKNFAGLVVRTEKTYITQCGFDSHP